MTECARYIVFAIAFAQMDNQTSYRKVEHCYLTSKLAYIYLTYYFGRTPILRFPLD